MALFHHVSIPFLDICSFLCTKSIVKQKLSSSTHQETTIWSSQPSWQLLPLPQVDIDKHRYWRKAPVEHRASVKETAINMCAKCALGLTQLPNFQWKLLTPCILQPPLPWNKLPWKWHFVGERWLSVEWH